MFKVVPWLFAYCVACWVGTLLRGRRRPIQVWFGTVMETKSLTFQKGLSASSCRSQSLLKNPFSFWIFPIKYRCIGRTETSLSQNSSDNSLASQAGWVEGLKRSVRSLSHLRQRRRIHCLLFPGWLFNQLVERCFLYLKFCTTLFIGLYYKWPTFKNI